MPSYWKHLEYFKYLPTPYKKRSEEGKTHHCVYRMMGTIRRDNNNIVYIEI